MSNELFPCDTLNDASNILVIGTAFMDFLSGKRQLKTHLLS